MKQNNLKIRLVYGFLIFATVAAVSSWTPPAAEAASANLITNPSFEDAGTGGLPLGWKQSSWGSIQSNFVYPVTGHSGAKAAAVSVTQRTNGDAKWYFDDVPVTAGETYDFSDYYKSTAASEVDLRYTYADGHVTYHWLAALAAAPDWTVFENTIEVPADAVSVTVFHLIYSVGTLTVDDYSLAPLTVDSGTTFDTGMISLTFDDGWYNQYENALPILDNAGIKGTFFIVTDDAKSEAGATADTTVPDPANLIANPSFTDSQAGQPTGWNGDYWGNIAASFDYPVPGPSDAQAAKVTVTSRTDGDAKWYFNEVPVVPGDTYQFSDQYKSTVGSEVDIEYLMADGTYQYDWLADLPAASSWTDYSTSFTVPANVAGVSIFHLLYKPGELTVDNYVLSGEVGAPLPAEERLFMNPAELQAMSEAGQDIGDHTLTHAHLTQISPAEAQSEIAGAKQDLYSFGIDTVKSFAYPYGEYDGTTESLVQAAGFTGARSVDRGYNTKATNRYALKIQQIDPTTTIAQVQQWINKAKADKTWLILMFHDVMPTGGDELSTTPQFLQGIVDYVQSSGIKPITMAQGLDMMP